MINFLYIDKLTFSYESAIEPLFDSISFQLQTGWTGVVGANGSGKTTLLKLVTGFLQPESGNFNVPNSAHYSEQRTDFMPTKLPNFLNSYDKNSFRLKHSLKIQDGWNNRCDTLSHGERKCCQIAVALYKNPSILTIDEPSNHIDYSSKMLLIKTLSAYKGIGLLVSHDREMFDSLCSHMLFISPPKIDFRKGNYSLVANEIEKENEFKTKQYVSAKHEVKKLNRKVAHHKEKARQSDNLKSKRNIDRKDHDAKSKKDLARLTGKDAVEGQIHKRLKTQMNKAVEHQYSIDFRKSSPIGISFKRKDAGQLFPIFIRSKLIKLGEFKTLKIPDICIDDGEKIGIVGNNGSGKSTFLHYLFECTNIQKNKIIFIPQEIPIDLSKSIIKKINNLNNDQKSMMMSLISRLGSEPLRVLETERPSPGELRKLLLAEGLMKNPGLIIMDEPTNHMDLISLKCIEKALEECNCSLMLVSHDYIFLRNLVSIFWCFTEQETSTYNIEIKYSV
jgi:macrolide transport system ATP-binding/permease protein